MRPVRRLSSTALHLYTLCMICVCILYSMAPSCCGVYMQRAAALGLQCANHGKREIQEAARSLFFFTTSAVCLSRGHISLRVVTCVIIGKASEHTHPSPSADRSMASKTKCYVYSHRDEGAVVSANGRGGWLGSPPDQTDAIPGGRDQARMSGGPLVATKMAQHVARLCGMYMCISFFPCLAVIPPPDESISASLPRRYIALEQRWWWWSSAVRCQ